MPLAGAGLQRQETHPISAIMSRDPNPLAFQLPADPARLKLEQPRLAKRFWRKLKHTASYLPGAETFLAAFYAAVDPKTPTTAKAVLFGALGYFIVPVDFIPDIFGAMGYGDDLAVMFAAVKAVEASIRDAHRERAADWLRKLRRD
jgi:uncharacterized membrane protein YkvA (DUF1232 family)